VVSSACSRCINGRCACTNLSGTLSFNGDDWLRVNKKGSLHVFKRNVDIDLAIGWYYKINSFNFAASFCYLLDNGII